MRAARNVRTRDLARPTPTAHHLFVREIKTHDPTVELFHSALQNATCRTIFPQLPHKRPRLLRVRRVYVESAFCRTARRRFGYPYQYDLHRSSRAGLGRTATILEMRKRAAPPPAAASAGKGVKVVSLVNNPRKPNSYVNNRVTRLPKLDAERVRRVCQGV
ncbi:hypothetical protein V9T40_007493 [Parthenolecanium corni]|uniref:Uncharacterized protein n=1 Tax=Parthenolecanium corni TaxID=536013 RepID=A0AAN9TLR7_9HEMI